MSSPATCILKVTDEEKNVDDSNSLDENKIRGNWSSNIDFVLSILGYAVGLGNLWRFPYLCYRNGGGAFLIPYLLMLFLIGLPMFVLMHTLGQFSSNGFLTCWKFSPIFRGVGLSMLFYGVIASAYSVIISWTLYYTFASFTSVLPWSTCDNPWNTKACMGNWPKVNCSGNGLTQLQNGTCYNQTTFIGVWDRSIFKNKTGIKPILPSEEYYYRKVMHVTEGIHDFGTLKWDTTLTSLACVLIVYFCVIRGIKSAGKVVYFTATLPYLMLLVLIIRGCTLPNASKGIYFYLVPDFSRLIDPQIWYEAATQILWSLSLTAGGILTCASYNRFNQTYIKEAIFICIANSVSSLCCGFAVFSFLGYIAGVMDLDIEEVVQSGAGLVFVVYPAALSFLPLAPLWSILFFLMAFILGIDTQFVWLEASETAIADLFPKLFHTRKGKLMLHTGFSIFVFVYCLLYCTEANVYWLQLQDIYMSWNGFLNCALLTIALSWVYGVNRVLSNAKLMIGDSFWLRGVFGYYWKITWVLSPVMLFAILLFNWIKFSPMSYGNYRYPIWAVLIGWTVPMIAVIFYPAVAIYEIFKQKGTFFERVRAAASPAPDWGPALPQHRILMKKDINGMPLKDREVSGVLL